MSQFERGGMNLGRWPADIGNVADDPGAAIEETADEDQERLAALPDHEIDTETSQGGGILGMGGSGEDRGIESAGGEAVDPDLGDDTDDQGLPLGKTLGHL